MTNTLKRPSQADLLAMDKFYEVTRELGWNPPASAFSAGVRSDAGSLLHTMLVQALGGWRFADAVLDALEARTDGSLIEVVRELIESEG